jgi:WhiB family redox-sensing transcriptional regulator
MPRLPSRARPGGRSVSAHGRGSWQPLAACAPSQISLFFVPDDVPAADRRRRENAAKLICASCPVREDCLRYAIDAGERHGIWGGKTATERPAGPASTARPSGLDRDRPEQKTGLPLDDADSTRIAWMPSVPGPRAPQRWVSP